jgi:hypothetical protein
MANVTSKRYKDGSCECEVFGTIASPITVGSGTISLTHSLGGIPDVVQVTPVAGYVIWCTAATASALTIGGGNASATAIVVAKRAVKSGDITETAT